MPRKRHVDIRRSRNGYWYYVLVGGNGEDGPVSETYTRRYTATQAALRDLPGVEVRVLDGDGELVRTVVPATT